MILSMPTSKHNNKYQFHQNYSLSKTTRHRSAPAQTNVNRTKFNTAYAQLNLHNKLRINTTARWSETIRTTILPPALQHQLSAPTPAIRLKAVVRPQAERILERVVGPAAVPVLQE